MGDLLHLFDDGEWDWPVGGCNSCPFAHVIRVVRRTPRLAVEYECVLSQHGPVLGPQRPLTPPAGCPLRAGTATVHLAEKDEHG